MNIFFFAALVFLPVMKCCRKFDLIEFKFVPCSMTTTETSTTAADYDRHQARTQLGNTELMLLFQLEEKLDKSEEQLSKLVSKFRQVESDLELFSERLVRKQDLCSNPSPHLIATARMG